MPFPVQERLLINASWLLRLRWVAVIGQLTTIGVVAAWYQPELPFAALLSIISFTVASNVGFALWLRMQRNTDGDLAGIGREHRFIAAIFAADLVALTGLLYFTGGLANPFAVFYFVNLSLAAVILPARWSWCLTLLAIGCVTGLLLQNEPLTVLNRELETGSIFAGRTLRQVGLAVALVACASVVTYFVTRVTRELQQRESQLHEAEIRRARGERLEALATLAAGAGHELASPLSTIAVIAKDLAKHLEGVNVPDSVLEDVALIRSELDQCRRILDGMASSAGQAMGEAMRSVEVAALVHEVISVIRRQDQIGVTIAPAAATAQVFVPFTGLTHALRGLVRNALDASSFGELVELAVSRADDTIVIAVRDRGAGMPPEILARVGEPFFTTKEPGRGMGLGLFLARNVIERLGGEMRLASTPGTGTTVTVKLPVVA